MKRSDAILVHYLPTGLARPQMYYTPYLLFKEEAFQDIERFEVEKPARVEIYIGTVKIEQRQEEFLVQVRSQKLLKQYLSDMVRNVRRTLVPHLRGDGLSYPALYVY